VLAFRQAAPSPSRGRAASASPGRPQESWCVGPGLQIPSRRFEMAEVAGARHPGVKRLQAHLYRQLQRGGCWAIEQR